MSAVCSLCGASPDPSLGGDPPLGWSTERGPAPADDSGDAGVGSGLRLMCGVCTRRHVRDIEAKLDPQWW